MTDRPVPHAPTAVLATTPILLVIVAGFVLAGMDAIAKHIGQLGVPVLLVLWGRYFFHTVLTFVSYAVTRRSLDFVRARRPGLQLIRAACLFGATTCFYTALTQGMQLGDAAAIQFLAPVLVTAFSGIFLGERVGPRRWSAVVVAFLGFVVGRPGSGVLGFVAFLPLATAVLLAVYMILTRTIRTEDNAASTTFYTTAVGGVALTLLLPNIWQPLDTAQWGLMVLMGAAGALGHFLLVRAFHAAEASALAPFTYAQVVGAILWGFVVFSDVPSIWTLVGASMIVGSGIYVWYREMTLAKRLQD